MAVKDIPGRADIILITLLDTQTKMQRVFRIINNTIKSFNVLEMVRKYSAIRPTKTGNSHFFITVNENAQYKYWERTRCQNYRYIIAKYLKLPNRKLYIGHSLRRTSASLLVQAAGNILTLKMMEVGG